MKIKQVFKQCALAFTALAALIGAAHAADKQPNIILIMSDDFGYGDAGIYGGGEGRGMPTPNLDKLAHEGMQFNSLCAAELHTGSRSCADWSHSKP